MNETSQDITISAPGIIFSSGFEISLPTPLSFLWIKYYNSLLFKKLLNCKILIINLKIFKAKSRLFYLEF